MSVFPVSLAQLSAVTRLYDDYVNGRMDELLAGGFTDSKSIDRVAEQIEKRNYPRVDLVDILRRCNRAIGSSRQTLDNIERLGDPQSLCVFAGQQTGIFIGPMLTIYKALSAVKLALRYGKLLNRPVIPCFWMATDDHDFAEISSAGFLERGGEYIRLSYDSPDADSGLPIANLKFDENILPVLDNLEQSLQESEFKKPLCEFIRDSHRPGDSIAQSFARLFNHLIGEYGIVLVDPNFPGLKTHFKQVFINEIKNHKKTYDAFDSQTKKLSRLGYHAQIHKTSELLNLFYHNPKRLNLIHEGDFYRVDKTEQKYTLSQLSTIVEQSPQNFSPNALLRPIAQASAFPTLCQITGPSELAYYAQIAPMFELFDVPLPIIFPRPGLTIIEPQARRIIEKYQLDIVKMKQGIDKVVGDVINRLFPSDAAAEIDLIKADIRQRLSAIGDILKQSDPDSYQLAANFQKKIDFDFGEFQKKLKAANKKRHEDLAAQLKRAYNYLFPENQLQERLISPVYYASKFGPKIFDQIYKSLDIEQANHMVMEI
jgi:bacillithiol biosynthesis cysteine-adding enzyme BshC